MADDFLYVYVATYRVLWQVSKFKSEDVFQTFKSFLLLDDYVTAYVINYTVCMYILECGDSNYKVLFSKLQLAT